MAAAIILLNFLPPLVHQCLELICDLRVIGAQVLGLARVWTEDRKKDRFITRQRLVAIRCSVVGNAVQY